MSITTDYTLRGLVEMARKEVRGRKCATHGGNHWVKHPAAAWIKVRIGGGGTSLVVPHACRECELDGGPVYELHVAL